MDAARRGLSAPRPLPLDSFITGGGDYIFDGTHLRMEQSGFRAQDGANYQGSAYGWARFLDGLERVAGGLD